MSDVLRVVGAGLVLVVSVACGRAPERILVGVAVNSRTHPAIQLAIDEINAAGGIRGVPLRPMGMDWDPGAADATGIVEWAERFADEPDLLGVIGHSDSVSTLTSAAVYNRRRVPQLVTIATNPAITDIGPWTYRLCLSDARQGPALARYAAGEWGRRRVALFFVNDDYGKGLAHEFVTELERIGGEVVERTFHGNVLDDDDKAHIETVLERLRALPEDQAPDLFVLVQRTEAGLWTISRIRALGFTAPILGADNFALDAFLDSYPTASRDLRVSSFYPAAGEPASPRDAAFRKTFLVRTGRRADYGDAYAYDAVYLFRDAVAAGGFSRAGVKAYLDRLIADQTPVDGVAGSFVLGPDHDARRSVHIVELRDGVEVPVATIDVR